MSLNQKPSDEVYVCPICDSDDIEQRYWVNINTMEVNDLVGPAEGYYCNKCGVERTEKLLTKVV